MYSAFSGGMHTLAQIAGISALVSTRRRDDSDTALETFLLQQLRTVQLVYALCTRKPLPSEVVIPAIPLRSIHLDSLFELAFRVPPCLETFDAATNAESFEFDESILEDLVDLENALLAWLETFRISYHCLNNDQATFGQADFNILGTLGYKSFFSLTCETLCQICLLVISECQASYRRSNQPRPWPIQASEPYSTDLCRTTTALIDAASSPLCKARSMRGPLHFLNRHYAACGDLSGLRWCKQIRDNICKEAPYLYWDGLLPWTFMALTCMPG